MLRRDARRLLAGPDAWDRLLELGWTSLACEPELGEVLEEMGRTVAALPFFSTVCLAGTALKLAGDDRTLTTATLAWEGSATVRNGALTGEMTRVVNGATAGLVLVAASDGVWAAEPTSRRALPTLDATRPLAELTFVDAPAEKIGDASLLGATLQRAAVALAHEQLGGAERCLELALDYARTRVQFGRPIGSFQAIKHKLADMFTAVETARSACAWADREPSSASSATAKAWCSDAYFHCAAESLQIHGGLGFTWEHPAHLHLRRARASRAFLGTPDAHREALAREIL